MHFQMEYAMHLHHYQQWNKLSQNYFIH